MPERDQTTQDIGGIRAEAARGEVDDQRLALIHDLAEADRFIWFACRFADQRMGQEGAQLVGDRCDAIHSILVSECLELDVPEVTDLFVVQIGCHRFPEALIDEEGQDVPEIGLWLIEQCQDGVPKKMFHPDAPRVTPLFFQGIDQAGSHEWPQCGRDGCEWVVAIWTGRISDVPVDLFG